MIRSTTLSYKMYRVSQKNVPLGEGQTSPKGTFFWDTWYVCMMNLKYKGEQVYCGEPHVGGLHHEHYEPHQGLRHV